MHSESLLISQERRANHSSEPTCENRNNNRQLARKYGPIHLLALSERNIVGVATLKDQSALHKLFPDFQYWLSGVYVPPALRSRGIATALCLKMVDIAKTRGVTRLHLVTEVLDGGLYAKIGWNPIRQVHVDDLDLLVMARDVP